MKLWSNSWKRTDVKRLGKFWRSWQRRETQFPAALLLWWSKNRLSYLWFSWMEIRSPLSLAPFRSTKINHCPCALMESQSTKSALGTSSKNGLIMFLKVEVCKEPVAVIINISTALKGYRRRCWRSDFFFGGGGSGLVNRISVARGVPLSLDSSIVLQKI